MKNFSKVFILMVVSGLILHLMHRYGLLDLRGVLDAFKYQLEWIAAIIATNVLVGFVLSFRYKYLLKVFGIDVRLPQVMAASFVSFAVGQWAPGSLAVMEIVRVGLMFGADKHSRSTENTASQESTKTKAEEGGHTSGQSIHMRIAVASLFDRLIGFFTILAVGAVVSLGLFVQQSPEASNVALFLLGAFSALGALAIGCLPIFAKLFLKYAPAQQTDASSASAPKGLIRSSFKHLRSLCKTVVSGSQTLSHMLVPVGLSLLLLFVSALSLYLASLAIGQEISMFAIIAVFPVMALSQLLPIGFAGMGGQQLVAVAVFQVFSLNAATVSSASLLQNALLLATNTFLGLLFAHLSASQIKAILARPQKAT